MKHSLIKAKFQSQLITGSPVIIDVFPIPLHQLGRKDSNLVNIRLAQILNGKLIIHGDQWSKLILDHLNWNVGTVLTDTTLQISNGQSNLFALRKEIIKEALEGSIIPITVKRCVNCTEPLNMARIDPDYPYTVFCKSCDYPNDLEF